MILDDDFEIAESINEQANAIRQLKRNIKMFINWKSSQLDTLYCGIMLVGAEQPRTFEASEELENKIINTEFLNQIRKDNNVNLYTARKIVLKMIVEDLYDQAIKWINENNIDATSLNVNYKYGKEYWSYSGLNY